MSSLIAIRPVSRESWKRLGCLPVRLNRYVMKLHAASCVENCFRMAHSSDGPFMVRTMYYIRTNMISIGDALWPSILLTLVSTSSGINFATSSSHRSFLRLKYSSCAA